MNRFRTLIALTATCLFIFGCESVEEETDEVIGLDELGITIDEALDDIEATDELADEVEAPSDDLLGDLDVAPEDEALDREARRLIIKRIIREVAADEPCALRGVLGGRYASMDSVELDIDADGVFRGRAFRRERRLVAVGQGVWNANDDAPGGLLAGRYENFEGNHGQIEGTYSPDSPIADARLGSFAGTWTPEDASHVGGNIGGVWHPTRDGRGVFIGYWSRCDEEPVHAEDPVL